MSPLKQKARPSSTETSSAGAASAEASCMMNSVGTHTARNEQLPESCSKTTAGDGNKHAGTAAAVGASLAPSVGASHFLAPPKSASPVPPDSAACCAAHGDGSAVPREEEQMQQFLTLLQEAFQKSPSLSTLSLAASPSFSIFGNHDKIVGLVKSLQANEYLLGEQAERLVWTVTPEGEKYVVEGTPEFLLVQSLVQAVDSNELPDVSELRERFPAGDVALSNAVKNGWVEVEKSSRKVSIREVPSRDVVRDILDAVQQHSSGRPFTSTTTAAAAGGTGAAVNRGEPRVCTAAASSPPRQGADGQAVSAETKESKGTLHKDDVELLYERLKQLALSCSPEKTLQNLKRRKLVDSKKVKYLVFQKGKNFSLRTRKRLTDITADLLQSGAWRDAEIKAYNFFSSGKKQQIGGVHPLTRVLRRFKHVLSSMGFEEMETNQYVESSFWCFDALFMPQQHPVRDVQDTFFLSAPACSEAEKMPRDYIEGVRAAHEKGVAGSVGWQYDWCEEEAMRNVLRTHTTATSAQLLLALAQEFKRTGAFRPRKFFSIDRVFRNETLDATHLAEFHQVEGLVADRGLTLGHLIGVMETFYKQIGVDRLRFKPAYNPYTEPSMEIFGYHTGLKKWIEVGNSGIFRPEMLRPMGLPPDVTVIAWGLSLERPTMIRYGIANIRELFGSRAILGGA